MINYYNEYMNNTVLTSTPEELILMLYDGCIKFINRAIMSIDDKNWTEANSNILRAEDIITELRVSLDMRYEISRNLDSLYEFFMDVLVQANISKDKEKLMQILPLIKDLRGTWAEAEKKV
ncbi:MAG: flagellar export chaperone FliS [Thermoanaerobacteraceae bacterium]|nr:flagellar export chaperone FliS [Thermoanaerobacteraceae bacterium]